MQTQSCSVYRATSPSGKRYYGIAKDPIKRWRRHELSATNGRNTCVGNAIAKYGIDAMNFEVLFTEEGVDAVEKCLDAEMLLIAMDNTMAPNGYNRTIGGDGIHGYVPTDEYRAKLSVVRLATWQDEGYRERTVAAMRKAKNTPEYRAKRVVIAKAIWADDSRRKSNGAAHKALWESPEYRKKAMLTRHRVQVVCVETGAIFESAKAASDWVKDTTGRNVVGTHITCCCKGKQKSAGGYTWKYV